VAILIQNCAIEAVQNSTIFLEKFDNILADNPYCYDRHLLFPQEAHQWLGMPAAAWA
jgi:hypothetical protein